MRETDNKNRSNKICLKNLGAAKYTFAAPLYAFSEISNNQNLHYVIAIIYKEKHQPFPSIQSCCFFGEPGASQFKICIVCNVSSGLKDPCRHSSKSGRGSGL
jgi:hypothetical protein